MNLEIEAQIFLYQKFNDTDDYGRIFVTEDFFSLRRDKQLDLIVDWVDNLRSLEKLLLSESMENNDEQHGHLE